MKRYRALAWPFVLALAVAACDDTPTHPDQAPAFAAAKSATVVTTLAEWQNAITTVKKGGQILVQGTIEIPGGEEVFLAVAKVFIGAATDGSGLRGVANGGGVGPRCLICLGAAADGATVQGLMLDGLLDDPGASAGIPAGAGLMWAARLGPDLLEGVTFRGNVAVCDDPDLRPASGCQVHVFLAGAPDATFVNNVLLGHPSFSAIQIQGSPRARVIDNWIEHSGPAGGIRIRAGSDDPLVVDNTIASAVVPAVATRGGITTEAPGGTYRDNKILVVVGSPSCRDLTVGSGTAGTASTWIDNQAPVPSDPVGICKPK